MAPILLFVFFAFLPPIKVVIMLVFSCTLFLIKSVSDIVYLLSGSIKTTSFAGEVFGNGVKFHRNLDFFDYLLNAFLASTCSLTLNCCLSLLCNTFWTIYQCLLSKNFSIKAFPLFGHDRKSGTRIMSSSLSVSSPIEIPRTRQSRCLQKSYYFLSFSICAASFAVVLAPPKTTCLRNSWIDSSNLL